MFTSGAQGFWFICLNTFLLGIAFYVYFVNDKQLAFPMSQITRCYSLQHRRNWKKGEMNEKTWFEFTHRLIRQDNPQFGIHPMGLPVDVILIKWMATGHNVEIWSSKKKGETKYILRWEQGPQTSTLNRNDEKLISRNVC